MRANESHLGRHGITGTDRFIELSGLKLHYVEHGAAGQPAFVCLHGIGGHGHLWDTFAAQICDRYHVFALTTRGHGDSDRSDTYEGNAYAGDVAAFVEATASAPAVVCGHSMGGSIGIRVAALQPDKVARLIIIDSGPEMNHEGIERIAADFHNTPSYFDTLEEAMNSRRLGVQGMREDELRHYVEYDLVRGEDGKLRGKADPALLLTVGRANPEQVEQMKDAVWTACSMIRCPTLIVRGRRSDILAREVAERMVETIPGARLVEIDSGHMAHLEDPQGFYKNVRDFIDS